MCMNKYTHKYIYIYIYIYIGIVWVVRSRARSKNEVWSPAGCPYISFAALEFQDLAKTHIFQNEMNLNILGHTPFCLGQPNTLLRETAKPLGHPKGEIVKTESTPRKSNWILEGVAVVRQSSQHPDLTQTSWHTGQTHILYNMESLWCNFKWRSKLPSARSAEKKRWAFLLGLGT